MSARKTPEEWGRWVARQYDDSAPSEEWQSALARKVYCAVMGAVAAEREACACLAEDIWRESTGSGSQVAAMIVNAIRARTP